MVWRRTQESCQVESEKRSVYPTTSYLFSGNKRTPKLSSIYLSTNKQTVGGQKGLRQSECTRPRIVRHFFPLKRRDGGFFTSGSKEKEYFSVSHFDTKLTGLVIFYWKCLGWPTAEVDAIWRWLVGIFNFSPKEQVARAGSQIAKESTVFLGPFLHSLSFEGFIYVFFYFKLPNGCEQLLGILAKISIMLTLQWFPLVTWSVFKQN